MKRKVRIGLIVAIVVLLLVIAAVVVAVVLTTKKTVKYSCQNNVCVQGSNGKYADSTCDNVCLPPKYSCVNYSCQPDPQGTDLATCQQNCTKFNCTPTGCVGDTDGQFATKAECRRACNYTCDANTCTQDANGKYEGQQTCIDACTTPPPGTKFNCTPTGCVGDTDGQYNDIGACQSACAYTCDASTNTCTKDATGKYQGKQTCTDACAAPSTTYYACNPYPVTPNSVCGVTHYSTDPGASTSSDCNKQCAPQTYSCQAGLCKPDPNNKGDYNDDTCGGICPAPDDKGNYQCHVDASNNASCVKMPATATGVYPQDVCIATCYPDSGFCSTNWPAPQTTSTTKMPWDQTGFMQLTTDDCTKFESALKNGVLHGMPYFPFCDVTQVAASDDTVSKVFCNGNQFGMSQHFVANSYPSTTMPQAATYYVAPYGQVLANLDPPIKDNQNFTTAPCNPGPNQKCVNGFLFNQNSSSTSVQRLKKSDGSGFKYKIAVYHGGLVGPVSSDVKCFSDMYGKFADFVKYRQIDIVMTSLQQPILDTPNKPGQFLYNLTPDAIIDNFYSLLPSTTTLGMLTYIDPKDSSWNFQSHDTSKYPNAVPQSTYDAACTSYGIKTDSCFVNKYTEQVAGGSTNTPSPWCVVNDADLTPTCPNVAGQLTAYIAMVNDAIQARKSNSNYTGPDAVTIYSYDTEDAGGATAYGNAKATWNNILSTKPTFAQSMMPDTVHAAKRRRSNSQGPDLLIGDAGSSTMVPTSTVDDFVMPEIYWGVNDLIPCTGSSPQWGAVGNAFDGSKNQITFYGYPSICTTGTSYRQVGDLNLDGGDFFKFLKTINQNAGKSGLVNNKDLFGTLISNFKSNRGVWPMMSCENLSGCKDTRPKDAFSCLARAGLQGQGGPKLCGTFDGISYWTWDQVIQFFNAFYEEAFGDTEPADGTPVFALYELQFIPPSWMCDSTTDPTCTSTRAFDFTPSDATFMPNCKGGGGGGGGGGGDPCTALANDLPCDNDQVCIDFANAHASVCSPYYGECRDTGICQFHPNVVPPTTPCAPTTSIPCTGPTDQTCQTYATSHQECKNYVGTCVNQECLFTPTSTSTCQPPTPLVCPDKNDKACTAYVAANPSTCTGINGVCRVDAQTPFCDFFTPGSGNTCAPDVPPSCTSDDPCTAYVAANPASCSNYEAWCETDKSSCHFQAPKDNQTLLSQVPHKRHDMQLSYASYSKIWN